MGLSVPFWVESRLNAVEARDLASEARLLAARIRAQQDQKATCFDHDLLVDGSAEPELIFHVVLGPEETEEVHVFLDERMLGELRHNEPHAWQGLIEFVEDDIKG